ncbi:MULTISPECIES: glucokinase [Asticcacaulis]|uniref:glucokinase n=1 Tax=Asticcacaulis TaxID=76890 RepID=UPI001AE2EE71|nr:MULTISPECIES: glucokinase [Asticcacaulis]MBP2159314.1 glucokinase [Asticcacaulis solisilvae]MDR6800359.1 glucokinase [Asticcacaulis sp. BE141]
MTTKVLLGDLSNGSYLKLAVADAGQRPTATGIYACASAEDFEDAVSGFLADNGDPQISGAAFSTSGWEVDGKLDLVHYGFSLHRRQIADLLGVQRLSVCNDFVAKALAVPVLEDHERVKVCGKDQHPEHVIAVVGPTGGLGGAYLSPDGRGGWSVTHCEGGHSDFAPRTEQEIEILKLLMKKYDHVSCERGVSSAGLVELWDCLCLMAGDEANTPLPEEILALAYSNDARALEAIRIQTELYASVASDFALTMGARGGVYLAGSYLALLDNLFDHDVFARRFYDKGRVSSYVKDIPVYRITAAEPEILGLSTVFG